MALSTRFVSLRIPCMLRVYDHRSQLISFRVLTCFLVIWRVGFLTNPSQIESSPYELRSTPTKTLFQSTNGPFRTIYLFCSMGITCLIEVSRTITSLDTCWMGNPVTHAENDSKAKIHFPSGQKMLYCKPFHKPTRRIHVRYNSTVLQASTC